MQSKNIVMEDNELDGMKFGGIFADRRTATRSCNNRMTHLNTAHCNENARQVRLPRAWRAKPEVLETRHLSGQATREHPAPARGTL